MILRSVFLLIVVTTGCFGAPQQQPIRVPKISDSIEDEVLLGIFAELKDAEKETENTVPKDEIPTDPLTPQLFPRTRNIWDPPVTVNIIPSRRPIEPMVEFGGREPQQTPKGFTKPAAFTKSYENISDTETVIAVAREMIERSEETNAKFEDGDEKQGSTEDNDRLRPSAPNPNPFSFQSVGEQFDKLFGAGQTVLNVGTQGMLDLGSNLFGIGQPPQLEPRKPFDLGILGKRRRRKRAY